MIVQSRDILLHFRVHHDERTILSDILTRCVAAVFFSVIVCAGCGQPMNPQAEQEGDMSQDKVAAILERALRCETDLRLNAAEAAYLQLETAPAKTRDWRTHKAVTKALRRIKEFRAAFSLTESALHRRLAKTFSRYQPAELREWEKRGLIEFRIIDGKKRYATIVPYNAAYRDPSLRLRNPNMGEEDKKLAHFYLEQAAALDRARAASAVPGRSVSPLACVFHMKVSAKRTDLPRGRTVRVWMPIPLLCPSTQDIRIVSVRPAGALKRLPDLEGEVGVAYMEIPRPREKDLEVELDVAFQAFATDFEVDPKSIGEYDTSSDLYKRFTRSEQHVRVTPQIRALAEKVVADETNPYGKARRLYDWVVEHIPYSGIWPWRESIFSPFGSGSEEVMLRQSGDCVIQSQFYAALCRSVGVPARVCGGFIFIPGIQNDHFWTEVYLPGHGWMPVDTTACEAALLVPELTAKQKRTLRDFFFGRLDPYRMHNHRSRLGQPLVPEKRSARRRAAFFTKPELECGGEDVETVKFNWNCECKPLVQKNRSSR